MTPQAAHPTRALVEWMPDTRPSKPRDPDREPTNAPIFLAIMAVMLIGLSLIASIR